MNEMNEMLNTYRAHTAARAYIIGFLFENKIYYTRMDELNANMLKLDKAAASKGGMLKIRVKLNARLKAMLVHTDRAHTLGAAERLDDDKWNRGDKFEKLVVETLARTEWHKNNTPFWEAGDAEIYGASYQIKFDGAELTNAKTLARFA